MKLRPPRSTRTDPLFPYTTLFRSERASEHPLALAIVEAAMGRNIDIPSVSDFDSPTGKGALGVVEDRRVTLGNARFLAESGVDTAPLAAQADQLRADGATAIFMGLDSRVAGVFAIADPIKPTKIGRT